MKYLNSNIKRNVFGESKSKKYRSKGSGYLKREEEASEAELSYTLLTSPQDSNVARGLKILNGDPRLLHLIKPLWAYAYVCVCTCVYVRGK